VGADHEVRLLWSEPTEMAETFRAARSPYEKHTTRCANGEDEIRIRADDESDISTMGSGGELIPNAAQQEDDSEDRIKSYFRTDRHTTWRFAMPKSNFKDEQG